MILVTGTGDSGTTFIWAMLRELGYTTDPTGIDRPCFELLRYDSLRPKLESGELEWPQVVKHLGGFCYNLRALTFSTTM